MFVPFDKLTPHFAPGGAIYTFKISYQNKRDMSLPLPWKGKYVKRERKAFSPGTGFTGKEDAMKEEKIKKGKARGQGRKIHSLKY